MDIENIISIDEVIKSQVKILLDYSPIEVNHIDNTTPSKWWFEYKIKEILDKNKIKSDPTKPNQSKD